MTTFSMSRAVAVRSLSRIGRPVSDDDQLMADYCRAVWSCVMEPGDGVAGSLIEIIGAEDALRCVLSGREGRPPAHIDHDEWRKALARWRPRLIAEEIDGAFSRAEHVGATLALPGEAHWPTGLDDLGRHRPVCLWMRSNANGARSGAPMLAIVGARAATSYGERIAMELSGDLAQRGVTIVSGAAYGIDGSAHRAAMTVGGRTVALLAGGVDRVYPAGHARLLESMLAHGALYSEVPCGSPPTKWRFLQRNRLIAAISHGTIVVEAGWRSGSLNTAGHAAQLGRPLGAVPGPVTSAGSAGCHRLLRDYDAYCITSADDAAELIGLPSSDGTSAARPGFADQDRPREHGDARTDDRTRVRDALSMRSRRATDDVARRCGMAPAEVEAHLGLMVLAGEVDARDGGWRRAAIAQP